MPHWDNWNYTVDGAQNQQWHHIPHIPGEEIETDRQVNRHIKGVQEYTPQHRFAENERSWKEMFYFMMHSTHFIYSIMALDI